MDYQLKPVGKTCSVTGKPLEPGSLCHSVLLEQDGEPVRLDYSAEGWNGPPEGAVGYWKCLVPVPTPTHAAALDADQLMRYFEQLSEDAQPAQEKFRYVLALLLLQKRRLRIEGSRRDGEIEYLQVAGTHGEGQFEVRDHQLASEEIQQLQQNLDAHLSGEWR